MKQNGKTQGGHAGVLHTILKCCEGFARSMCQGSQKMFLRPMIVNGARRNKEQKGGSIFLLQNYTLPHSNSLVHKWENLSQRVSSGRKGPKTKCKGRKHLTNVHKCRDTEGSLLPTGHHQCPSHMLWVSPTNSEDTRNAATLQLSPCGGPRFFLGQTVWQRDLRVRGQRTEQQSLWSLMGRRAPLDAHHGGMPRRGGQGGRGSLSHLGDDTRDEERD